MFISLDWISDFVDLSDLEPKEVADKLTMATAEVEGISTIERYVDGVLVGEIVSTEGDYCTIKVEGIGAVSAYNDRKLDVGRKVHLSVRPEKIRVTRNPPPPEKGAGINVFNATVTDIIYQGVYTKYWLTSGGKSISALKPHSRFLLDQESITWKDKVYLWWHPDDGYMVENFSAMDMSLIQEPPASKGSAEP